MIDIKLSPHPNLLPMGEGTIRDVVGRTAQEHLQGCKWLKTSGTSFPAKVEREI